MPREAILVLLILLGIGFVVFLIQSLTSSFISNPVFYIVLILIIVGIIILTRYLKKRKRERTEDENTETTINENQNAYDYYTIKTNNYEKKNIMTENERMYWEQLQRIYGNNFIITPQVPLSSIVQKSSGKYAGELYRTIDFGIFTKNNYELKALVEINDRSHFQKDRVERDRKVKDILEEAGLSNKLVTIWTYESHSDYDIMQKLQYLLS